MLDTAAAAAASVPPDAGRSADSTPESLSMPPSVWGSDCGPKTCLT
jgi:hypothetical protein